MASIAEECSAGRDSAKFNDIVMKIIFPAIKKAMKSFSETIRHQFIGLLEILVTRFPHHPKYGRHFLFLHSLPPAPHRRVCLKSRQSF